MPDAIVIGAGPNGLVAANVLASAGWSVTVLEAQSSPGGAVRTSEITLPGYHHDLFSGFYPLAIASPAIARLGLEDHGLTWRHAPVVLAHPSRDGNGPSISRDLASTVATLDGDGDAWTRMIREWERIEGPLLRSLFGGFPPLVGGADLLRRLGPIDTLRFARSALLPVRRMATERFTGTGGALLLGGAALHADIVPEGAGSGFYGWLLCCLGQRFGFPVPEGGAGAFTDALVSRLTTLGGNVHCDARVTEIVVRRGRAVAVRMASGETLDARRAVIADVSAPALYRELLRPEDLPAGLLDDLKCFEWDTATIKIDWALAGDVPWTSPDARLAGTVHVADDFDNFTEAAAQIAMGRLPSRPFLLVGQPSLADRTRAPEGGSTVWAYTHVPADLRVDAAGIIPDGARAGHGWLDPFVERIESRIETFAPGFSAQIRARHVLSPDDFSARDGNLFRGAIGGGTAQLHQQFVFRPLPGSGRPETPVTGLYLGSASAHPGAGVHGAPGANAARAALALLPRGRSIVLGRGRTSLRGR